MQTTIVDLEDKLENYNSDSTPLKDRVIEKVKKSQNRNIQKICLVTSNDNQNDEICQKIKALEEELDA